VAFIAGADLAHVGPRFGDPQPVSQTELATIDREDRAMLQAVEAGDADGFFESVRRDGDRRRICGLSPIYTLLRVRAGAKGRLRQYGQWPDPQGVVSFASVVFP
jgi:AmmeMemoRadiSam system protein B